MYYNHGIFVVMRWIVWYGYRFPPDSKCAISKAFIGFHGAYVCSFIFMISAASRFLYSHRSRLVIIFLSLWATASGQGFFTRLSHSFTVLDIPEAWRR